MAACASTETPRGPSGLYARANVGYGQALDGAIMEYQGQILTVKMVGSADEVRVAAPALEMYLQGLRPAG